MPCGDFSCTASAILRVTGALKRRLSGRIGMQAAWAFSRSQPSCASNGARTCQSQRFSMRLATPLGVATPLPNTSVTRAAGGRVRLQARVAWASGAAAASRVSPSAFSTASRGAPVTARTGTRSPMPSTAHHTLASRLSALAGPLSFSKKICCSSIGWPS